MEPSRRLTARELQMATLVGEGLTNSEVAGRLGVSERTVDNGLRRIYARVGLHGRREFRAWLAVQDPGGGGGGPGTAGLPAEVSSFVGRDEALFELMDVLGTHRLVTLTGPGGVGKTRLALQAARRLPVATYLIELGRISDPDLVDETVMRGLGLRPQPGVERRQAIADHLGSRRAPRRGEAGIAPTGEPAAEPAALPPFLLVDCCEHVIGAAAALIDHLLRACASLRILATSREPLLVEGERVWQVQPLEVPATGDPLAADAVRRHAAVRLFAERAEEAGAGSPIRARDLPLVVEICRRLDGLPLALELAAARMRAMSLEALLARLDEPDSLGTLVTGKRAGEERHRTLRATVDWSYRLLTPPERRLFARLSVFAGSFDLRAAASMGDSPEPAMELLSALVDRSLVSVTPGRDGDLRYRMLDTLRAFGRERLVQSGEYEAVRERHARHYADVLSEPALSWSRAALNDVEEQLEDIRVALAWSCDNRPELVNLICGKLVGFWGRHGHLGEAREWMDRILDRLPNDDMHRALALADAAWLAQRHGSFDDALRYAWECLRIQRLLGRALYVADALNRVADVARHLGDYEVAVRCAGDALAIRRVEGGPDDVCLTLMVLGTALGRQGDLETGRRHLEEARALFPSSDEAAGVAYCDCWLGELEVRAGDLEAARAHLGAALSGFRETPDAWMVANLYDLHAWLAAREADRHRALRLAGAAEALRREVGASQPPALAGPLARALEEARGWVGSRGGEVWREGAEASAERVNAYALREAPWRPGADVRASAPGSLTARELDVVPLIARGLADKEIAARLGISVRTAEYHVDRVRKKLGFSSRAQIAAWAVEREQPSTPVKVRGQG